LQPAAKIEFGPMRSLAVPGAEKGEPPGSPFLFLFRNRSCKPGEDLTNAAKWWFEEGVRGAVLEN